MWEKKEEIETWAIWAQLHLKKTGCASIQKTAHFLDSKKQKERGKGTFPTEQILR